MYVAQIGQEAILLFTETMQGVGQFILRQSAVSKFRNSTKSAVKHGLIQSFDQAP